MATNDKSNPNVPSSPAPTTTNGERLIRVGEAVAPASSAAQVTKLAFVKSSTGEIRIDPKTPPSPLSPGTRIVKLTD